MENRDEFNKRGSLILRVREGEAILIGDDTLVQFTKRAHDGKGLSVMISSPHVVTRVKRESLETK